MAGGLGGTHTGPNSMHALKKPKKTLSLHPGVISRLKDPLVNKFSMPVSKGGSFSKRPIFNKRLQCIQRSREHGPCKGT